MKGLAYGEPGSEVEHWPPTQTYDQYTKHRIAGQAELEHWENGVDKPGPAEYAQGRRIMPGDTRLVRNRI